jgi:hypothetical protein
MTEAEFLTELVNRTRCRLLCDVSNVYLSAHNIGYDAHRYLDSLPGEAIAEWHLGGFTPEPDEFSPDSEVWVDTHAAPIADRAWDLYAYAIRRFGARPALVEWDNQIPTLAALLHEAPGVPPKVPQCTPCITLVSAPEPSARKAPSGARYQSRMRVRASRCYTAASDFIKCSFSQDAPGNLRNWKRHLFRTCYESQVHLVGAGHITALFDIF